MATIYQAAGKRFFDVVIASVGLIVTSPIQFAAAISVRMDIGSPVLFRHQRPGKDGESFVLLKFRTMRNAVDSSGHALPDERQLTALGRFLRSTSIDELPELWNVLRGQMSLVGPRPLLMEYLERYTPEQARRLEVRPGITGLAQTSGRNAISWEEKFRLDVQYVEDVSLALDLKILGQTIIAVFRRGGIAAEGHATMPEFRGNPPETDC